MGIGPISKANSGFSDSTDIYIKHDGYYGLVIATGRYYIFSHMEYAEKSQTAISPVTHAPIVLRSQPVETKIYYILDYQTGQIEELKAKKVKKILEEDPELLKEYQDEFNQQGLVVQYIRRYNEKHPAQ